MSSNKTTNYQLHLWEPEDNFLRTEFNENSEKVDAALGELASKIPYVLLMDTTVSASAYQVNLDVSDIDFTAWRKVVLLYEDKNTTSQYLKVLLNNNSDAIYFAHHNYEGGRLDGGGEKCLIDSSQGAFPGRMRIQVDFYDFFGQGVEAEIRYLQISDSNPIYYTCGKNGGMTTAILPSQVTSINLLAYDVGSTLPQGAQIRIWGVRAW